MNPYQKKFFVPFLVPLVPLAIAIAAIGGVKLFTVGAVALGVWLAWRQSTRMMRRCGGGVEHVGYRGGMFGGQPPAPSGPPSPPPAAPDAPPSPAPAPARGPAPTKEALPAALARAAARRGGYITVSEGVVDTGAAMLDVSEALDRLDRDGFVTAVHRLNVDEVVYRFQEIAPPEPGPATPTTV